MEYLRGTNILEHRFVTESAAEVRLLDFCPELDNDHILMSEYSSSRIGPQGPGDRGDPLCPPLRLRT